MKSIFVSSTFKDMQSERDLLHRLVIPVVNDFAKKNYGNNVRLTDLRWGITTDDNEKNDVKEKKILDICFDEIDESKPYIIVLIGQRYGWIPDAQLKLMWDPST